jgi:hypothetical protein
MSESSDADATGSSSERVGAVRAPADPPTEVRPPAPPAGPAGASAAQSDPTATPTLAAPPPVPPPPPPAGPPRPGTAEEPSKLQTLIAEKPELLLLGAFAGGLLLAIVIRRLGR